MFHSVLHYSVSSSHQSHRRSGRTEARSHGRDATLQFRSGQDDADHRFLCHYKYKQDRKYRQTEHRGAFVSSLLDAAQMGVLFNSLWSRFWGTFANLRKATISHVVPVCTSVCPHAKTRRPLDGFSWNLIFEYSSKICTENTHFIKIWQE
jgi:hypothetical protein